MAGRPLFCKTTAQFFPTPVFESTNTTAMPFPVPQFRPPPLAEPTPVVQFVARESVGWDRPIFKAPPLDVFPKMLDSSAVAEDIRRVGLGER